jgi:hypothetical protein
MTEDEIKVGDIFTNLNNLNYKVIVRYVTEFEVCIQDHEGVDYLVTKFLFVYNKKHFLNNFSL